VDEGFKIVELNIGQKCRRGYFKNPPLQVQTGSGTVVTVLRVKYTVGLKSVGLKLEKLNSKNDYFL
jgi:hypothetical protein